MNNTAKRSINSLKKNFFLHFEWIVLLSGLLLMAFLDPFSNAPSYCILDRLGLNFCPGCGLGKSIAHTFRGDLHASMQAHPAGIFAILVIFGRVLSIFHRNHKYKKGVNHEENI
tara:strand:- start:50811 stop:51152 length:342 start_codon:yes stop_codon:yes gene_type:complete